MTHWNKIGATLATLAVLAAEPVSAARVTLSRQSRAVTDWEVDGGAPAGALVHEFFVTSDSDLLTIAVDVDVPVYRHPRTSERAAPGSDLTAIDPAAAATSFIATPGETLMLGGGFSGPGPDRGWGDLTNDGPQQNFRFAQLTVGQSGRFSGRIDLRGYNHADSVHYGFTSLPFSFSLPGSIGELGLLESEPTYALEYSLDPPPPPALPPVDPNPPPFDPSPAFPEPVVTPPAETPELPPVPPEPEPVVHLPPPFDVTPPLILPPVFEVPPPDGLIDVGALVDVIPIELGGLQRFFALRLPHLFSSRLPRLNVVTIDAAVDLGADIDIASDVPSQLSLYTMLAQGGDSLVDLAAWDGDGPTVFLMTASLLSGNAASLVVAADVGSHIPEPATASLLGMAIVLGRAGFRCRR